MDGHDLNKPYAASSEAYSVPPPFRRDAAPALPAGRPPPATGQLEMGLGGNRGRGWPSLHVLCGGLAVLWGAAIIVTKLLTIGGWSFHHGGSPAYRFGLNFAVLFGAALLVAGTFHLRRGIRRYRDLPVAPVTGRNRLVNLGLTVALFGLVLLAAPFVPDPDGRFDALDSPYSYRYPGDWAQDDARQVARAYPFYFLGYITLVARPDDDAGVLVGTLPSGKSVAYQDHFEALVRTQGGRVTEVRTVTLAGRPAVLLAYDMPVGRHDGAMTLAHRPEQDLVVWCQWESDPASAGVACDKVRETLQVKAPRAG